MKYTRLKPNPCRQVVYARQLKSDLFTVMGNRCALCTESNPKHLQIDHPHGRDWDPQKFSYAQRLSHYAREFFEGKIRLLCETCNLKTRNQHPDGTFYPTGAEPE